MRIAFYAPLKPPDHPAASGDRTVARNLMAALRLAGHDVIVASRLRSHDGGGDAGRQARIARIGERMSARLVTHFRNGEWRPDLWFTYHLYHKAPDHLGPAVSSALAIPYVVAEASFAPKQSGGRWSAGHAAIAEALRRADLVVALNPADAECVLPLLRSPGLMLALPPFVETRLFREVDRAASRRELAARYGLDPATPWLLAAAMMRVDQKLQSYRVLAAALARLADRPWRLLVAGGGPAEHAVRAAFSGLEDRVSWLGVLDPAALRPVYRAADVLVWPAVKEAWGMALVEAQAAGLPVVAGRSGGVASVVADGETGLLAPEGDAEAFAGALATLLGEPSPLAGEGWEGRQPQLPRLRSSPRPGPPPQGGREKLAAMSLAAEQRAEREHDIAAASRLLDARLRMLVT